VLLAPTNLSTATGSTRHCPTVKRLVRSCDERACSSFANRAAAGSAGCADQARLEGPVASYRTERVGAVGTISASASLRTMRLTTRRRCSGPVLGPRPRPAVDPGRRVPAQDLGWTDPAGVRRLRGDCRFVGPRKSGRLLFVPASQDGDPFHGMREALKPGITGVARSLSGTLIRPRTAAGRQGSSTTLLRACSQSLFLDLAICFQSTPSISAVRAAARGERRAGGSSTVPGPAPRKMWSRKARADCRA